MFSIRKTEAATASTSAATAAALARKEYLKKYETNTIEDEKKKKKKKKPNKQQKTDSMGGVLVVDEDPVWAKPVDVQNNDNEDDAADEEEPQMEEDIEVKRMKRMEQIRARRSYNAISEDGSGWVEVSAVPSNGNDKDLSPLRRLQSQTSERSDSPDFSPPRRNRPNPQVNDVMDDDISPPRRNRAIDEDISPPRRNRPIDEDISPPRRNRPNSHKSESIDGDISPPRRNRAGSQSIKSISEDISPPRRNRPNSQKIGSLSEDFSPPRRNRPHLEVTDALNEDTSPPRRRRPQSQRIDVSVKDLSPPRKSREPGMSKSSGLSPPRKISRVSPSLDLSPPRKSNRNSKEEARTGLLTAQDIKKEIERTRMEELKRYKELDPSVSGRGAEPVYRDKAGNRMSKDEVLKLQKGEEKPKEMKLEWGKGLAQKRDAEAREQELELEKERPFARTRDDPELDKMLKERVRWGDPMAHLVKPKHSEFVLEDFGDNEKMKESGFIIPQKVPNHSWMIRRIDAPPNRYGIKPGRHWDGVDRSTGFEKECFKRKNEKQATEAEAYMWSVSDM